MNLDDLQNICMKFPGVTLDIKWQDHLCFNVGGKIFIITSPDTVPITASFKVSDEDFEELSGREGFSPAAYLARYKWIHVDDINRLSKKQWTHFAEKAYSIVSMKLSPKIKKQLKLL